jgi:hypothetical protein
VNAVAIVLVEDCFWSLFDRGIAAERTPLLTGVFEGMGSGPAGIGDPIKEGLAVAAVRAAHESDHVEAPSLGDGIAMTPDIEDEQSAMDLAGGSAGKELIKFVWIELGGASEPGTNLDGKTGKVPWQTPSAIVSGFPSKRQNLKSKPRAARSNCEGHSFGHYGTLY